MVRSRRAADTYVDRSRARGHPSSRASRRRARVELERIADGLRPAGGGHLHQQVLPPPDGPAAARRQPCARPDGPGPRGLPRRPPQSAWAHRDSGCERLHRSDSLGSLHRCGYRGGLRRGGVRRPRSWRLGARLARRADPRAILLKACSIGFGYTPPAGHPLATMVGDARYDTCQPSGSSRARAEHDERGAACVAGEQHDRRLADLERARDAEPARRYARSRARTLASRIYVMNTGASDETVTVTLTGPSGAVRLFQPNKAAASTRTIVDIAAATTNGPTTLALLPAERLAYGSAYTLSVTPSTGPALHATFRTVAQPADPKLTLTAIKATNVGSLWHLSATVNLSVPFRPDADYDGINGLSRTSVRIGVVPVLDRTHQLFVTVKYKPVGGPFSQFDTAHAQTLKGSFSVTLPPLVMPGTILVSAHVPTWDGHADEHYNAKNIQARSAQPSSWFSTTPCGESAASPAVPGPARSLDSLRPRRGLRFDRGSRRTGLRGYRPPRATRRANRWRAARSPPRSDLAHDHRVRHSVKARRRLAATGS